MWFDSWAGIGRTVVAGVAAYAALIAILRLSGKRTLSKMNAFDLVVTVALGSTLATIVLSQDVALAEGLTALVLLVALQFGVAWLAVRSARFSGWMLAYQGRLLCDALRRERVTEGEISAALRAQGVSSLAEAHAVVLETDGTFTVLAHPPGDEATSALAGVSGAPQRAHPGAQNH